MRSRFTICFVAAVTMGTLTLVLAQAPSPAPGAAKGGGKGGRGRAAVPSGPTPHLPDGTVDLSGVWMGSGSNSGDISKGLKTGEQLVMLPWAEALMKTRKSQDDPEANCLPTGVPRGAPYP